MLPPDLTHALMSPRLQALRSAALEVLRASYRRERPLVPTREELAVLLDRRGLLGAGVEVGVREAAFSEHLLDHWQGRSLTSVDPWREAPPGEYVDKDNVAQAVHDRLYDETRRRLERFGSRSTIWRTYSADAADRVPPASLDFVYIDARHDHASVREDLALWFGRVRAGGMIAGHDYLDGHRPEGLYGVRSAVDEFFGAQGLPVRSTFADGPFVSWYVLIPSSR